MAKVTFKRIHDAFAPTMRRVVFRWEDEYRYEAAEFERLFAPIARRLGGEIQAIERRRSPLALRVWFPDVGQVRISYDSTGVFAVRAVKLGHR